MPHLTCSCGNRISYGEIPCPDEWLFISDVDFDAFAGQVDSEVVYRSMRSFLRCPICGHLWIFWGGYQAAAQEFEPATIQGKRHASETDGVE